MSANAPQGFPGASFCLATLQGPPIVPTLNNPILYPVSTITGQAITYSAGIFSLSAGHTYMLTAGINTGVFSGATGNITTAWRSVTGTAFVTLTNGINIAATSAADGGQNGPAISVITTLVDSTVAVHPTVLTAFTNCGNLWATVQVVG